MTLFTVDSTYISEIYSGSETKLFSDVINAINRNNLLEKDLEKYDYYVFVNTTKDNTYTKEEVSQMNSFNYNIMPKMAYLPVFLLKDRASNYAIQKSLVSVLKLRNISGQLNGAADLVNLSDKEMTVEEVETKSGISKSLIGPIFSEIGKEKVTGKELIAFLKNNNYIIKVGNELKDKINEVSKELDYAIKSFDGVNYSRIILNMNYHRSSKEAIEINRLLQNDLKDYYDNYYIASECGAFIDFEDTFAKDSIKISVASLCFILIIIAFSFRSIAVPIILTLIIQGAIWFTMAISVWTNWDVYFICYLMIVCIQMGTTIDYGILYTSKYLEERKNNDIETSITSAFHGSITTILTSGTIIVVASFIVGVISKVSIISSIGFLLSVGTMVSLAFILFALPQVLVVSEKFIEHTTIGFKNKK